MNKLTTTIAIAAASIGAAQALNYQDKINKLVSLIDTYEQEYDLFDGQNDTQVQYYEDDEVDVQPVYEGAVFEEEEEQETIYTAPAMPAPMPARAYTTMFDEEEDDYTLQSTGGTYTVKSGDSLSAIASRNGCTVAQLTSLNGIANANSIFVGQKIKLCGGSAAPAPTPSPSPTPSAGKGKKMNANQMAAIKSTIFGNSMSATQQKNVQHIYDACADWGITDVRQIAYVYVFSLFFFLLFVCPWKMSHPLPSPFAVPFTLRWIIMGLNYSQSATSQRVDGIIFGLISIQPQGKVLCLYQNGPSFLKFFLHHSHHSFFISTQPTTLTFPNSPTN